jgi:hypothetical protein
MSRPAKNKELSHEKALSLLRKGSRLMLMRVSGDQSEYYVIPGGKIFRGNAEKIIARPDMHLFDDGLFPGNPQSWKMGG